MSQEQGQNQGALVDLSRTLPKLTNPMLPAGDAAQQIAALIERPDTAQAVQQLEPPTLFGMIKSAGFDQGVDLIPYCSPVQLQACLDFDAWRRDQLLIERQHRWFGAIAEESSDAHFKEVMRELDSEIVALYFKRGLQVYLADDGRIPEDVPDEAVLSPDGQYAIIYPEDETWAANLRLMVKRLYELDMVLAWTLLEAVRWELVSDMEEYAYRWRNGRMQDWGFVPREEAMAVYRPLDPAQFRERVEQGSVEPKVRLHVPDHQDLPSVLTSEFSTEFFVLEAIGGLEDAALVSELLFELSTLSNRALIADGIEPGELSSGRQVIRRTLGYLSLGLEFLSRAQLERARQLLSEVALRDIFRAGYTAVYKLQHQARQLSARHTLTMVDGHEYSLLNDDERAFMEGLMRIRPTFAKDQESFDLFKRQAQVDQAALMLGQMAIKQLWLFGVKQQSVEQLATLIYQDALLIEPIDVTFDMCMATMLATLMARGEASLTPLAPQDIGALLVTLRQRPWEEDFAAYFNPIFTEAMRLLPQSSLALFGRWVQAQVERLLDELGQLVDERDAMIVRTLVLLARQR